MKYLSLFLLLILFACAPKEEGEKPAAAEDKIHAEEVVYTADGDTLKGYLAYDQTLEGRRPGVLIVHEWWGHNDYARKRARMLAELGYTAFAVDMYGNGKQAAHSDDALKFATEVMQNLAAGEARFNAALELLKNNPMTDAERIGAIGYCFGGSVVLHMARIGTNLDGVVSFHGGLASMHQPETGSIKSKILVCNGADDAMATAEQIEAFKNEMDAVGADYNFISYEGAKHSFTNPDADKFAEEFNLPLAYNAEADSASWQEMQNFFKEIFAQKAE
jgi:dienelactone hydrolase